MSTVVPIELRAGLELDLAAIPRDVAAELKAQCTHTNPEHAKLRRFAGHRAAYKEPATIATWSESGGKLVLPRGAMSRLRAALRQRGIAWQVVDRRTFRACAQPAHQVQLWDHQARIVKAAIRQQTCAIRAPTGSGKTTAAIAIISQLQTPALVVVWNSALAKQWRQRLQRELNLKSGDIGQYGGGRKVLKPITVAMQQTLTRLPASEWKVLNDYFGLLVCDELQRFGAKTFNAAVARSTAKYRIGVSADETRKDKKEFLIYDQFAGVAASISERELIDKRLIHDVEIIVIPTEFAADWYVESREHEETPDWSRLMEEMRADDTRNLKALEWILHSLAEGHPTIVFTHRREHAMFLDGQVSAHGYKSGLLLGGEADLAAFERNVERIKTGELQCGVGTYQAIGVGHDLPAVTRGVAVTPIHTNQQFWKQVRGRLCRTAEGKSDAQMIYLWDRKVYGHRALLNIKRWNNRVRVFNGTEYVSVDDYIERG